MSDLFKVILYDLGIDVNEEFELLDERNNKLNCVYRIDEYARVQYKHDDIWCDTNFLAPIILGKYKIVKKPFQPKENERYWCYYCDDWRVSDSLWINSASDYAMLKCGCIFRTKEKAEHNRALCYKELTGKEWQGK